MKMRTPAIATVLAWFLFLACSSAFAQGGIYKWTDSKGRIHYSNAPTRKAESVDESLPPASTFGTQPEPEPSATTSTAPAPTAPPPPAETDETPPAEGESPAAEPTAENEPGMSAGGPLAAPAPSAPAGLSEPAESDDAEQGESEQE